MMENNAETHRQRTHVILQEKVYGHQRQAARNTMAAFDSDCRTVILAAEMQSGKSGVALALACMHAKRKASRPRNNKSV